MNSTLEWILTIAGAALTLLTVYGAVTSNRKLFLSGLCYFSFIPFIGEGMAYCSDKVAIHVIVIVLFLIQFVLALPNNNNYGADNVAATKLARKIGLGLLIINVGAIIYIFHFNPGVSAQFGYYHVAFALSLIYLMIKGISWAK